VVVERTVMRMVENTHLCEIENMCVTTFIKEVTYLMLILKSILGCYLR